MTFPAPTGILGPILERFRRPGIAGNVARGAAQTVVVTGLGAGIGFVMQFVLARVLGVDAYGVYLTALSWLTIGQIFGKFELDTTAVRFVGSYSGAGEWGLLRGFLSTGRSVVLTACTSLGLLGAVAVFLMSDVISAKHPGLRDSLLVVCAMLPVMGWLLFECAVLQGFQKYAYSQLPQNLIRPLGFAALVLVFGLQPGVTFTPSLALLLNMAGAIVALVVTVRWRKRMRPEQLRKAPRAFDKKTWQRTALPLYAISVSQGVLSQQADILVVGMFLGVADAGIYGAASTLTLPLIMAATAITFVAQPMIAELYATAARERLQSLIRAVTWLTIAVVLPIGLVLTLAGSVLLGFFGPEFATGHAVLVVLTLSQLVVAIVGGPAGFLMTMTAHERPAAWIIGLSALLYIALAFLLTPRFGAMGTASATLIATSVRALSLSTYVWRVMRLRVPSL